MSDTVECIYMGPYQVLVEGDVEYRVGDTISLSRERYEQLLLNRFAMLEQTGGSETTEGVTVEESDPTQTPE